ncbi:FadR/GntR family transcriptional regulator [Thalassospira sp. TSL5-1]|uniref:FadR/GntR family transcriptional regulator n=1 Tax=Thalassospira sp. TSL5-1 TaxID=1544451 RepID=UPI00093DA80F|nr:GntR family transcriptional regulator [Thalassospira sp. TSL5-1]
MRASRPLRHMTPIAGTIEIRGIIGTVVARLGERIVSGEWPEGSAIAKEADLVTELDVSRSVIREACRILTAKGLIRSRTSDGTRVLPRSEWRMLDPDVMDWRLRAGDRDGLLRDLLKFCLILEPGIVEHASMMADTEARQKVDDAWQAKKDTYRDQSANEHDRRAALIGADLAFHQALINAAGSELIDQIFPAISSALELMWEQHPPALSLADGQPEMELYEGVYYAFCQQNPQEVGHAMRTLIEHIIARHT